MYGGGADLTIVGLPEGLTVNALGTAAMGAGGIVAGIGAGCNYIRRHF